MKNICDLKGYANLKMSGQSLITEFISNLFGCEVNLQQVRLDKFEGHFGIDVCSNLKRSCYRIDDEKLAIIVKVFEGGSVIAIMPIILKGENIKYLDNRYLEDLSNVLSKQMTECYNNSFYGGTKLFGEELAKLVVGTCVCAKNYDDTRIIFLIELLEKLSATTFEGSYFSTGFILSRSLYAYNGKNGANRNGNLLKMFEVCDLLQKPVIDKRFWYLVDGKESFYIMDQNLKPEDIFIRNGITKSWKNYFDSYLMKETLLGDDIAFRVIGPNEVSIVGSKGIEFVKIENKWRMRNYEWLDCYLKKKLRLKSKVREAIIYYIVMCSNKHNSSIIWIPKESSEEKINLCLSSKNKLWKKSLSILEQGNAEMIYRILSSDGVTVIDRNGDIVYCGGIVKLDSEGTRGLIGTGETATKILSDNGIAIKISQDGNIKIFSNSKRKPIIY